MKIEKLWVVVRPSPASELGDVCFETDAKGLAMQFKGGLAEGDVHALYTGQDEAEKEAKRILSASKRYYDALQEGLK